MPITECPTGLRGEVRELLVREQNILMNQDAQKKGDAEELILKNCWEGMLDAGPYPFQGDVVWDDLLVGDSLAMAIDIRKATYGTEYTFPVQCSNWTCRRQFNHAVDLDECIEMVPFDDEGLEGFSNGNEFHFELPKIGKNIVWKMLTGREKKLAARRDLRKRAMTEIVSIMLALRIVRVEGVGQAELKRFFDSLPASDNQAFLNETQRLEPGIEGNIDLPCQECGVEFETEIPFTASLFFAPPPTKQRRRGRNRAQALAESSEKKTKTGEQSGFRI